jgi:hypothetical protein
MDEGDLETEHAPTRRLVDQLGSGVREMREGGADVIDLVGDVVHARAAPGEEPTHGRLVAERAEQLESALPDADGRGLDPLLLDAGALLEPRAEQPLVRVECVVEILDGETDMVHGARRVHSAIVFERLAPTMRGSVLALAVTAALLAGCGGSSRAAKPNGEASKLPGRVLTDARAAAASATFAHVSGSVTSSGTPITLDLSMVRGEGAKGSMSTDDLQFDLVRIGDTAFIRGSDAFYEHFAGSGIAQLLHGKWIKAPITKGRFSSLAPLTSIDLLLGKISANHGKLVNDGTKTYEGKQVIAIRDTSDNSRLYVSASGRPYPVALVGGKASRSGTITFGQWSKRVSLSAPNGAVDISTFGG